MAGTVVSALEKIVSIRHGEISVTLAAFACFFCLLCGYYVLRPLRDSMAITAGVDKIQWLFTATFVVMLLAVPFYGWVCARLPRWLLLPGVYLFFVFVLLLFYALFASAPDDIWTARAFYIWVSVFNLFMVSVFWSFMADVFSREQAHRVFGFIAAGGSAGAICGPALTAYLVERVGQASLLLLSAGFLGCAVLLIVFLLRSASSIRDQTEITYEALGGHPFAGFTLVLNSSYLLTFGLFICLLATISTFLYFQQAYLIEQAISKPELRTRLFARIDLVVNILAITSQIAVVGRIVKRYSVTLVLTLLPVVLAVGFMLLAVNPVLAVVVAVMIVRRVGEYAFIRPCREMLFTTLDRESRYKAKNFVDTVVYRGADAVSAWFYALLNSIGGLSLGSLALIGALLAGFCASVGYALGKRHHRLPSARLSPASPIPYE